jgi:hypothetical protein
MTDAIRANAGTGLGAKPTGTAKKPALTAAPSFAADSYRGTPPTAAQLETHRTSIAALADLPAVPRSVADKRAWLEAHAPILQAAQKALSAMESGAFYHKTPGEAVVGEARGQVRKAERKFQEVEEEAGLRAPIGPANPFRPLFGFSQNVKGLMGSNPFGAVLGVVLLVPALAIDLMDAVTRPLQAVAYPFLWGKHKVDQLQYEAAKRADEKK